MPNELPYPDLSDLSFEELLAIREKYNGNKEMQNYLAPYEHQAFARKYVSENPIGALPMLAMIPGYEAKKVITGEGRSDPSLKSIGYGYKGLMLGLLDILSR